MSEKQQSKIVPFYDSRTDSLIVYVRDTPSYGKPIDDRFTVFLDAKTESFVGFEIAGFRRLAETLLKDVT